MFQKFLIGSVILHIFFFIGAGFCLPPIPVFEDKPVYFEVETVQTVVDSPKKMQSVKNAADVKINPAGMPSRNRGNKKVNGQLREEKSIETAPPVKPSIQPAAISKEEIQPEKIELKPVQKQVTTPEATTGVSIGTPEKNQNKNSTADKKELESNAVSHTGNNNPVKETSPPTSKTSDAALGNGSGNGTNTGTGLSVAQNTKPGGFPGETGGNKQQQTSRPPIKLYCPNPVYPEKARQKNWEGIVGLQILVKSDGSVGEVVVLKSSDYPVLDQEAVRTVKTWRYQPALKDGLPTDCILKIKFPFKLED